MEDHRVSQGHAGQRGLVLTTIPLTLGAKRVFLILKACNFYRTYNKVQPFQNKPKDFEVRQCSCNMTIFDTNLSN